jgi:hypothetical protein
MRREKRRAEAEERYRAMRARLREKRQRKKYQFVTEGSLPESSFGDEAGGRTPAAAAAGSNSSLRFFSQL